MGSETLGGDYRLADFKPLLPLGEGVRALVIDTAGRAFVPHLAAELGRLEVDTQPGAEGYDLVFSDRPAAACHLRPGGILCLFTNDGASAIGRPPAPTSDDGSADLVLVGRWRAWPDWPAFRVLIPEQPAGWRAARTLRLLPWRSWPGLAARLHAGLAGALLPQAGLALYRRSPGNTDDGDAKPALLQALVAALGADVLGPDAGATPLARWLIASGRLGPGNPILAFALAADGQPRQLLKIARTAGAGHLRAEAAQLATIVAALGPDLVAPIIQPRGQVQVHGRWALAYDYVPTAAFFGPRWRLQGRRRLCLAMTDWLAGLARTTARPTDATHAEACQLGPLRRLLARRCLPGPLQQEGEAALALLGAAPPALVLEHGDLGIYNLRLVRADGSAFRVLDWGSATFDGIAVGDLGYLLCSCRAPLALARRCLGRYMVALGLTPAQTAACWYGYLARRWEELDRIRPPDPTDPGSGGGLLLAEARRMSDYLATSS